MMADARPTREQVRKAVIRRYDALFANLNVSLEMARLGKGRPGWLADLLKEREAIKAEKRKALALIRGM